MNDTVVLGGEIGLILSGEAECELIIAEDGEAGIITAAGAYPQYEGNTTITPSAVSQTLLTERKTVFTNIIIEPIPDNYGLITWNGSTLTVS